MLLASLKKKGKKKWWYTINYYFLQVRTFGYSFGWMEHFIEETNGPNQTGKDKEW
jgi:hypothetical protein